METLHYSEHVHANKEKNVQNMLRLCYLLVNIYNILVNNIMIYVHLVKGLLACNVKMLSNLLAVQDVTKPDLVTAATCWIAHRDMKNACTVYNL